MDLLKNTKQAKLSCLKKNYKDCHKIPIMLPKAVPVVEESYNPDRTRLSLEFAKKQTIKTNDKKQTSKTEIHREKIRKYLAFNKLASAKELASIIELSAERTRVILSKMEDIIPVGENRNRMYKLKK